MNKPLCWACVSLLALSSSALASAEPSTAAPAGAPPVAPRVSDHAGELGADAAVLRALQNNPTLEVGQLRVSQARADVRAEEALYAPVVSGRAAITHSEAPGLRSGGISVTTSDTVDLAAGVSKPFSTGTVVGVELGAQRSLRSTPVLLTDDEEIRLGPGYSLTGRLTVTQPLLRGAGSDLGLASLRAARVSERAATLVAEQTASALARDVLSAYWELWYADQVLRINRASRDLAREQARQAQEQERSGALARIDVLTFTTRSAELEEAVLSSLTEREQRALAIALLMGAPGESRELVPSDAPAEPVDAADALSETLTLALTASPELAELEANVELAEQQLVIAGDALRPRLDLDGFVQVSGLGDRRVPPALEQVGTFEAVSAQVGLTFEAPLTDQRRKAQVASARYARDIGRKQFEATRQRVENDVRLAYAVRRAAFERLAVARETVRVAEAQADAERQRFAAGASIAIQVQQAEDSLRQARLRLERARVDWTRSQVELLHLSGRLLPRYRTALGGRPGFDGSGIEGSAIENDGAVVKAALR